MSNIWKYSKSSTKEHPVVYTMIDENHSVIISNRYNESWDIRYGLMIGEQPIDRLVNTVWYDSFKCPKDDINQAISIGCLILAHKASNESDIYNRLALRFNEVSTGSIE